MSKLKSKNTNIETQKLTPKELEKKEYRKKKREAHIQYVCEQTGWDREYTLKRMRRAKKIAGANKEYYAGFRLFEVPEDELNTFILKQEADSIVEKFNRKENKKYAINKRSFAKKYADFLGRPVLATTEMTFEKFVETFQNETMLVYKQQTASRGEGIEFYDLTKMTLREVYENILQKDKGLVEGFIKQHPAMKSLSENSVNTIRVVTVNPERNFTGLPKDEVYFVYAGIRIGRGEAFLDNAHAGGIAAAVDIDTGVILTNGYHYGDDFDYEYTDTGVKIKGFQIPCFQEMKEMLSKAGLLVPGYFGWDIAISEDGPLIVEVNSHPGIEGLQLPYVLEHKGMKHVMQKLLDAVPLDSEGERLMYEEKKKKECTQYVCNQTGWSEEDAVLRMERAEKENGVSFEEYAAFHLFEVSEEEQKSFFFEADAHALSAKFNQDAENRNFADKKRRFILKFSEYLGRPAISTKNLSLKQFQSVFKGQKRVVFKPQYITEENRIRFYRLNKERAESVYQRIKSKKGGIIEGFIQQHPEMQTLSKRGVNTVRVVTLCPKEEFSGFEPGQIKFLYAAVRICPEDFWTDQESKGGIVAGVDLESGKINTDGFRLMDDQKKEYTDTGVKIKGFQIPCFHEIKQLISEAGNLVSGYLGWDIAVSESGPVIVDLNTDPSAVLLQLPYALEHKGMRPVMQRLIDAEKVLTEKEKMELEKKQRQAQLREERIQFVCSQTGWDHDHAVEMMDRSAEIAGSNYEYYAGFRLFECTEEEQKQFFLKKDADEIVNKFNSNKTNVQYAWNKRLFAAKFADYLGRAVLPTAKMTLNDFTNVFWNEKKIIYKPQSSSAGAGIEIIDLEETSLKKAFLSIIQKSEGVVEGFIHQHP